MENRSGWLRKLRAVRLPGPPLVRWLIGRHTPVTPAPFDFDALARDLAGGLSRREAMRRVGVGLAAGLLSAMGLQEAEATTTCPPGRLLCNGYCCQAGQTCCNGACCSGACCGGKVCIAAGKSCCFSPSGQVSACTTSTQQCCPSGLCCDNNRECCGTTSGGCCPPGGWFCCGGNADHCCPPGQFCVNNQCLRTCPSGTTACVGTKRATCCPAGQYCCGGQCSVCPCDKSLCTGSKGTSCCAAGETCCDGACVNAQTDVNNCGGCGKSCPAGETCTGGHCGCPTGQTPCSGVCVNTQTDPGHCGTCSHACDPSNAETCCGGACITCHYDACCGSQGFACCLAHLGETCCDGACCPTGQHCENGTCVAGCATDANCLKSRPEVCTQGICCLPPGSPYYGGACNGACYTCPYDACCGSQGFGCCRAHLGETCCDGACCPAGQHCESGVCKSGCLTDANCISSRPEVCIQGICCLPPGAPYYGGACNGACYTCPYNSCCGSQGFGCCRAHLGETCCDGTCCPAGQHCQNNVCVAGCVADTNCAGVQVCSGGICV